MGSFEDAKRRAGVLKAQRWLSARSKPEKMCLAGFGMCLVLLLLYVVIEDHDSLFVMAETVHFIGIGFLAYKLIREHNCTGQGDDVSTHRSSPPHVYAAAAGGGGGGGITSTLV